MINIGSSSEFANWDGAGTATLIADIDVSTSGSPKALLNSSIFNGNGYKITITSGSNCLFSVPNTSDTETFNIRNLEVTVSNGLTMNGVILSTITNTNKNITVENCAINGTFTLDVGFGGVVANLDYTVNALTLTITGCYCTGSIQSGGGGGILGETSASIVANNNTISISNCYSTGSILFYSGGIVGRDFGINSSVDNSHNVTNCYSTGPIDDEGGGIVGENSDRVNITNCYSAGQIGIGDTIRGAILATTIRGTPSTLKIINCYALYATATNQLYYYGAGNVPTVEKCQVASPESPAGTWNANLGSSSSDTGLYNTSDSPWINTGTFSSLPFGLKTFRNSPWDTTYDSYQDSAQFLASGSSGDPHITTLDGKRYDLLSKGVFNLFDNNISDARLVINADTIYPDHPIWHEKEYINNLFINYKGKRITIKPGFRGKLTEILDIDDDFENDPHITLTKSKDTLSCNHKMFCGECKYRTRDHKLMHRHRRNNNHSVLSGIRNSINITIKDEYNQYNIKISNVNKDNFHPASVTLKLVDKTQYDIYSGAIIKEHEDYGCDIEHLHYISGI